jgi:hypothetical protein
MESLKQNTTYQILKLRLELMESNERERLSIRKFGYGDEAKKFKLIRKEINNKLDVIKQDLQRRYDSLELTSANIKELEMISNTLLEFKDFDETLLTKVENKIAELNAVKENATKNYDFKKASIAREESHILMQYFRNHNC